MMSSGSDYSEDTLIEQPAIALFESLGWNTLDCFNEFTQATGSPLGRNAKSEVVLVSKLLSALKRLNPGLPPEAYEQAIEELTRDRGAMSEAHANREVHELMKDGVKVRLPGADGDGTAGGETDEVVRVIDWNDPGKNDYFLASQFWITGDMYTRRADLVGFVNGLPLVFVELKATHRRLETAYNGNLRDYKNTIPQLFWYNAFIILSNGSKSKIGGLTAEWEHFSEWKKINGEGEEGVISLDTIIKGTCEPSRLLDIVENFTIFMETKGGLIKLVAKNHQYLGVSAALEGLKHIEDKQGRLGVFWHTQGSGKSISMIFFSQKILRKIPGDWTFVIVTDRRELDKQIYKNFAAAGAMAALTEEEAHARDSPHLRQLLGEDHRYVFTLIHKFRTKKGETHPVLSRRSDIVVITDESHRSQYDTFAANMRTALPNAAFMAFTGTPLMASEEKTKNVFGNYISIYNFKQSVDDRATVPLYYENRIPELQLTNEHLNEDIYGVVEESMLDPEQEKKLEREFSRQYHLITRDDRLETIAKDLVTHFMGRGFRGKALIISIDKATAIKMYDKFRKHWTPYLERLKYKLAAMPDETPDERRSLIEEQIRYMEETDMAVVVSQSQNEIEEMRKKGLDIVPHRRRMVNEDLETRFKDPDDPFRIAFVCAMWMTGFDVPSCSTIYLDKPMRNHTLMQTIARANRVFPDKVNGLIVDYVGVFRNLQQALAIYGTGPGSGAAPGETPVRAKDELVKELKQAIAEASEFCMEKGVNLDEIRNADGFDKIRLLDDAVDAIIINDEAKMRYFILAGNVNRLHRAILPDPAANEMTPTCKLIIEIARKIRALVPPTDISGPMEEVEDVLDGSISSKKYVIEAAVSYGTGQFHETEHVVDLSEIDFEALKIRFEHGRKRIEVEKLRGAIHGRLKKMVRLNRTRMDYLKKFQQMIDDYNSGSANPDEHFKRLLDFINSLSEEDRRSVAKQLSEEELAIFDLLTRPRIEMSDKDRKLVKKVARELLETLKREKIVLDWRKRQQSRAAVKLFIEKTLDKLPSCYTTELYRQKCRMVYEHIYESYFGPGRSVYPSGI